MLADLSIEKLLVLALIGLFVLGPERLPAAVAWLAGTLHRLRRVVAETQHSLQRDLGTDFAQLREPLQELREPLRGLRDLRRPAGSLARYLSTPASPVPAGGTGLVAGSPTTSGAPRPAADLPPPIDPDTT